MWHHAADSFLVLSNFYLLAMPCPTQPSILLTCGMRARCWVLLNLVSTRTPRSFSVNLLSGWILFNLYCYLGMLNPRWSTLHFSLLNSLRFLSAHLSSLSKFWMATRFSGMSATAPSFAYLLRLYSILLSSSLMKLLSSTRLSTVSWPVPLVIGFQRDFLLPSTSPSGSCPSVDFHFTFLSIHPDCTLMPSSWKSFWRQCLKPCLALSSGSLLIFAAVFWEVNCLGHRYSISLNSCMFLCTVALRKIFNTNVLQISLVSLRLVYAESLTVLCYLVISILRKLSYTT